MQVSSVSDLLFRIIVHLISENLTLTCFYLILILPKQSSSFSSTMILDIISQKSDKSSPFLTWTREQESMRCFAYVD
ncbi:hypothetical protein QVD17_38902 [Tagetes erecta]|uniref:Uncharacterized protein n=1 Tax=Tagetes erecta TaxID=13708 RepID=A0AAD8JP19_TARER|nr:hypothetical protein QVD17_38902 [Tagetes erecta]